MSVPGERGEGVALTGMTTTDPFNDNPAILGVGTVTQRKDTHRFQIEDVEETHLVSHQNSLTENMADITISSLGYNTAEAVPMTVYYRKSGEGNTRPTLENLRQGRTEKPTVEQLAAEEESGGVDDVDGGGSVGPPVLATRKKWQFWKKNPNSSKSPKKFGWITGVLIRCVLNIWGVMLFIRLTWVVGQAGIGLAAVIILLSGVVTVITTLSMSAICTNGEVKGGGAYYLISRSLGPEFGGAIGIIFSLANAVAVSLYVVGFAETVSDLIIEHQGVPFTGDATNDIRVVGFILVTLILLIALIGLDFEAIIQIFLLLILLVAIVDVIIGSFIPRGPGNQDIDRGFTGYSWTTIRDNFGPQLSPSEGSSTPETFFTVFAVFFPAATGILAGANISGDLKNPQIAIPKGTLLAIIITNLTYLGMAVLAGAVVIRNAPGSASSFFSSLDSCTFNNDTLSFIINPSSNTTSVCGPPPYGIVDNFPVCSPNDTCYPASCLFGNSSASNLNALCSRSFLGLIPEFNLTRMCSFGLLNNFQVMEMISLVGPVVTAGIFAATISSALTSLISAPKVFQTVCNDKIFPFISFFGKGGWKGTGREPIRGYFLTYAIALACISIGNLNQIAKIISNFFLMAYALINYSCFAASFAKSPGWRPAFKLYNAWVALIGSAICVAIMFIINWYFALVTIFVVAVLYKLVDFLKPDINWGSSTQAFLYSYSMRNLLKLEKLEDHVKNFRPQFLVLTGAPSSRPDLVHFVSHLSTEIGIMVCGQVLLSDYSSCRHQLLAHSSQQKKWLRREKLKGFHNIVAARSLREGCQNLLQLSGLGKLRPNTLVVGYKSNWTKCSSDEVEEYVAMLHDAFDLNFGVVIFRLRAGFDATDHMEDQEGSDIKQVPDYSANLRLRSSAAAGLGNASGIGISDQQLIGGDHPIELADVPLTSSSPQILNRTSSNPLNLMLSVTKSPRSYQPIVGGSNDCSSLDSYSATLQGDARLELEELEEEEGSRVQESQLSCNIPLEIAPEIITMPSRFERVQEKGNIDVWWLYDDGGLAILLPFLLSRHKHWNNCKLRIFTAGSFRNIDQAKLRMTTLLRKFRIEFAAVIEVCGINSRPSPESIDQYHLTLPALASCSTDSKELNKHTLRHIRLGELLHEHSSDARLIVIAGFLLEGFKAHLESFWIRNHLGSKELSITMSVPQREASAHEIMGRLEMMSRDLPPTVMMRGNQTSVLTFYS